MSNVFDVSKRAFQSSDYFLFLVDAPDRYITTDDNGKRCAISTNKVLGPYCNIVSLCEKLELVVAMFPAQFLKLSVMRKHFTAIPKEEESNRQEANFMQGCLLIEILMKMNEKDPQEMFSFLRRQFFDKPATLLAIEQFSSDYHKQSPVWWYTKPGFLYETLNKALREFNVLILFAMRVFVCQLHQQIFQLHKDQSLPQIILYRGQQMPKTELQHLRNRVGYLYSINQFLSTTTERSVALIFAGEQTAISEAVLLKISIDPSIHKFPFASIDSLSLFGSVEKEHLFSMGCIFRIESITQDSGDGVWTVSLSMTGEQDKDLNELMSHYRNEIFAHDLSVRQLGQLLLITKDYENAEFFLLKALEIARNYIERGDILSDLGITYHKRNPSKALNYFQQALDVKICSGNGCHLSDYASAIYNMAVVYFDLNKLDLALQYATQSYELTLIDEPDNHRKLGRRIMANAHISMQQENYSAAEIAFRQAMNHFLKILPSIHPDIADLCDSLASCLIYQGKIYEAYTIQQRAIDIALHSLPPGHPRVQQFRTQLESIEKLVGDFSILSCGVGFLMRGGNCIMGD